MIRKSFVRVLAAIGLLSLAQWASPLVPDSTGFSKLDTATLPITAKIHIGGDPDWLASGYGSMWVSVPKLNEIVRINPLNNTVRARIRVDKEPCYGIGMGTTRTWVLNCKSQTLTRINPVLNKVDLNVPVNIAPHGEGSIAVREGSVWFVSNEDGHSSTLVQMSSLGRMRGKVTVGADSAVVVAAFGSIWVTSSGEGRIYRVDPTTRKVITKISVPATPRFTTVGDGSVWVLSQSDGSVSRIDPTQNKVVATIQVKVPGGGGDIAYGGGYIWVGAGGTPLTRIDPKTNKVVDQYGNYKGADAIRFSFGSVWVSDHAKGDLWRINPLRMPRPKNPPDGSMEARLFAGR
jgi:virginiamycin B lyase